MEKKDTLLEKERKEKEGHTVRKGEEGERVAHFKKRRGKRRRGHC